MEPQVTGETCAHDWPEPDPGRMVVLIGSGLAYLSTGGYIVVRRRPRMFPLWMAALVSWFTLCKYLICTRCERFGERCDFYYLGRWAGMLFERQPDRTLDTAGIIAEGVSVAVLQFLPLVAAIGRRRLLFLYLVLLSAGQASLLGICCKKCVAYSKDPWKRETCPSYKQAKWLFYR